MSDGDMTFERLTDPDVANHWLGQIEGLGVSETTIGPVLYLHGTSCTASVLIDEAGFADGLARAGVELEALIEQADTETDTND